MIELPNEIINNTLADGDEVRENYDFLATLLGGLPQGTMINGCIETSVSGDDLTVAIKTIDGTDPSASNPVYVRIGNTIRKISAALSVTAADGTNWCNAGAATFATFEIDYFVYLAWEASDNAVRIGFSRIPSGRIYDDFSATSTNEKYAKWNNAPGAGDECEVVGRFNAILGASATYLWSLPATSIVISQPIYETRWLTYAPTWSAGGAMTFTSVVTDRATYKLSRNICFINLKGTGTTGGTADNDIIATQPFSAAATNWLGCAVGDTSIYAGCLQITATIFDFRRYDSVNFGLGAGRIVAVIASYEI